MLQENSRLQKEMLEVVGKLSESDSQLVKLQTSLDQMLQNKVQYHMLIKTMNSILILL